jgi:hypothetical protein
MSGQVGLPSQKSVTPGNPDAEEGVSHAPAFVRAAPAVPVFLNS